MNTNDCPHNQHGWCPQCVSKIIEENKALKQENESLKGMLKQVEIHTFDETKEKLTH